MDMEKDAIKTMIELSDTWEEADKVIVEFTPCHETREKLSYLYGMFDVSIIARTGNNGDSETIEADYRAVLSAIKGCLAPVHYSVITHNKPAKMFMKGFERAYDSSLSKSDATEQAALVKST